MRIGLIGSSASGGNNCYVLKHFSTLSLLLLSNAMHCMGQNIKSLVARVLVCVCVRARTGFG